MVTAGDQPFATQLVEQLAAAGVVVMACDRDNRIISWNEAAAAVLGWPAAEAIGSDAVELLIEPDLRDRARAAIDELRASGTPGRGRIRAVRRDGSTAVLEFAIVPFVDPEFGPSLAGVSADVTELVIEYEALREGVARFGRLAELSPVGIVIGSVTGGATYINRRGGELIGADPEDLLGANWVELIHPDDRDWVLDHFMRHVEKGAEVDITYRAVRPDGRVMLLAQGGRLLVSSDSWIGIFDDVTERQKQQDELALRAHRDPLTGLPNRTVLLERLGDALDRASPSTAVAVLFIDLDHFKQVNDGFGHDAGDLVLVAVAERLCGAVRPTDTVCRLGGDEFVVLCEGIHSQADAQVVLRRVRRSLQRTVATPDGREARISASVGVAVSGTDQATAQTLLTAADRAMYRVKRRRVKA